MNNKHHRGRNVLWSGCVVWAFAALPQAVHAACTVANNGNRITADAGQTCTLAENATYPNMQTPSGGIYALNGGQVIAPGTLTIEYTGAGGNSTSPVYSSDATSLFTLDNVNIRRIATTSSGNGMKAISGGTINVNGNVYVYLEATNAATGIDASGQNAVINLRGDSVLVDFIGNQLNGGAVVAELGTALITATGKITARTEGTTAFLADSNSKLQLRDIEAIVGVDLNGDGTLKGEAHPHGEGVWALENGVVEYRNGTFSSTVGNGLHAANNARISSSGSTTILVDKAAKSGVFATGAAATVQLQEANITVEGSGGTGILAESRGTVLAQKQVTVTGTANAGIQGVVARSRGTASLLGHLQSRTSLHGVQALGADATVTLGSADVESVQGMGMQALSGGSVLVNNAARVRTFADNMHGLWAQTQHGDVSHSQLSVGGLVDVVTQGAGAIGAYALGLASRLGLDGGGSITTSGAQAHGIEVAAGANLEGSGQLSIRTSGDQAVGIIATQALGAAAGAPQIRLGSVDIQTQGSNADGLQVGGWAKDNAGIVSSTLVGAQVVIEDQLRINVLQAGVGLAGSDGCGVGAAVCMTGDGASLNATGSRNSLTSAGSALVLALGEGMDVQLANTLLKTTGSAALLQVQGSATPKASSTVTLENSNADGRSGNSLLDVAENRALEFYALNSTLLGNVSAHVSSDLDMTLSLGSALYGSVQGANNLSLLDANSRWYTPSNSTLGHLTNAGNITFVHTETGPQGVFKTITVDNYVGQDGYITLSTHLGDENSPSDKLVITPTGTASGNTTLNVVKYSGLGALTVSNGVQVVEAQGGSAATTQDAFSLQGTTVPGGAYDYTLERNANGSWYLVSKATDIDPPTPGEPYVPVLRRELSLYSAAQSLAVLQGTAVLDSLHERKGGAQSWRENAQTTGPFWGRLIRTQGNVKPSHSQTISGDDFKYSINGIQLGLDLLHNYTAAGFSNDAGVFLAYADSSGDVKHKGRTKAGSNGLDSTSIGAYWSGYFDSGAYVDLVGMVTRHKLNLSSTRLPHVSSTGSSKALSLEVGMPFAVSNNWVLEPQAQLRMQRGHLSDSDDAAGLINFGAIKSLQSRIGLRAAHLSPSGVFWGRVDWLQEMQGKSSTSLSAMSGKYSASAPSSLHGGALALTAGVDKQLSEGLSLYGSASYQQRFNSRGHGYGANLGIKFAW